MDAYIEFLKALVSRGECGSERVNVGFTKALTTGRDTRMLSEYQREGTSENKRLLRLLNHDLSIDLLVF